MEEKKLKLIIDGCINQNHRSQKELYDYFHDRMLYICLKYTRNTDTAKDVLQDGFIKVFKYIDTFRNNPIENKLEALLYSWLKKIMFNTSIDRIRREKSNPIKLSFSLDANDRFVEDTQDIELKELEEIQIKLAIESIEELPYTLKTVTNKIIFENYTHKRVANELQISEGTSKGYYFRAKERLRGILEKKLKRID